MYFIQIPFNHQKTKYKPIFISDFFIIFSNNMYNVVERNPKKHISHTITKGMRVSNLECISEKFGVAFVVFGAHKQLSCDQRSASKHGEEIEKYTFKCCKSKSTRGHSRENTAYNVNSAELLKINLNRRHKHILHVLFLQFFKAFLVLLLMLLLGS